MSIYQELTGNDSEAIGNYKNRVDSFIRRASAMEHPPTAIEVKDRMTELTVSFYKERTVEIRELVGEKYYELLEHYSNSNPGFDRGAARDNATLDIVTDLFFMADQERVIDLIDEEDADGEGQEGKKVRWQF